MTIAGILYDSADASGSRSLVDDGITGFLAPPGDVPAFTALLDHLVCDSELRRRMGEAARAKSLTFRWDETLARMLGWYRAVAS